MRRSPATAAALLVLLVLLGLPLIGLSGCSCGGKPQPAGDAAETGEAGDAEVVAGNAEDGEADGGAGKQGDDLRREQVKVYFPSALADGLVAERREIIVTSTPGDRIKQIVNDLISGPASPDALRAVPSDTRLRQVFVVDDGTAYLDFSGELTAGMRGGSAAERLAVYAIVDSVVLNVKEVRSVGILVNGQTVESLNGHMDLRKPLRADTSLVLRGSA